MMMHYIKNKLERHSGCSLSKSAKDNKQIDKISRLIVLDRLDNKFNNGFAMNAVFCLFDTLFLDTTKRKKDGLYYLSKKRNEKARKSETKETLQLRKRKCAFELEEKLYKSRHSSETVTIVRDFHTEN